MNTNHIHRLSFQQTCSVCLALALGFGVLFASFGPASADEVAQKIAPHLQQIQQSERILQAAEKRQQEQHAAAESLRKEMAQVDASIARSEREIAAIDEALIKATSDVRALSGGLFAAEQDQQTASSALLDLLSQAQASALLQPDLLMGAAASAPTPAESAYLQQALLSLSAGLSAEATDAEAELRQLRLAREITQASHSRLADLRSKKQRYEKLLREQRSAREALFSASSRDALALANLSKKARADIARAEQEIDAIFENEADLNRARASLQQELAIAQAESIQTAEDIGDRIAAQVHALRPFAQWPVSPEFGISAHFADPAYEERFGMPHTGIDIAAPTGTLVAAPALGFVQRVHNGGATGYSYLVLLHADDTATVYGHLSEFLVEEGQMVRAGQEIARTGGAPGAPGTGAFSTGPHLHLEVRRAGTPVQPLPFFPEI